MYLLKVSACRYNAGCFSVVASIRLDSCFAFRIFIRMATARISISSNALIRIFILMLMVFSTDTFSADREGVDASDSSMIQVVTTFSILADMVKQVGGSNVKVHALVDWDEDAHVFQPSPDDVQQIAHADLLVLNGLGFEGWLARLLRAAEYKGSSVEASKGINYLRIIATDLEHGHHDHHHHEKSHQDEGVYDPHAWHSLKAAEIYLKNIADALITLDSDNASVYQANLKLYLSKLHQLDLRIHAKIAQVPMEERHIVVPHNAFAYFARDYQVKIHGLQGISTDSEASAADLAQIVRLIRSLNIQAIFTENISDKRLIRVVESETKAKIKGALVSGALSKKLAPTYLEMMEYNSGLIIEALTQH